jgi:hypothetical protein
MKPIEMSNKMLEIDAPRSRSLFLNSQQLFAQSRLSSYVPEIIFEVLSRGLFRAFWYLLRDELFTERFDFGPSFGSDSSRSGIVWSGVLSAVISR